MPGHETTYLIDTVGHALAKGIAATVAAQPDDPVEHLAEWLLSYVKSEELQATHFKEKKQRIEEEKRRVMEELQEQTNKEAAEAARRAAIDGLAALASEPRELWQAAVRLVKMHTSAAGVYVANIVDEEQPDWAPLEDGEADEETEDGEGEAAAGGEEAGEEAAENDTAAEAADASDGTPSAAEGSDVPPLPDYSGKLLQYVAASAGQEFMTRLQLRRPAAAEDESAAVEEGKQAEQTPITFKMLDEHQPLLEVPAVTAEPRVKFLRGFPRTGAYCAAAVPAGPVGTAGGSYHAVLAADTLLPEGHGQPLTSEEVSLVWEVAQALGKALDAVRAASRGDAARGGAAEVLAGLQAAVDAAKKAAAAPADVPEVGEEPASAADEGGEEGGGAEPLPLAELIEQIEAELQFWKQRIAADKVVAANAAAALASERDVLAAVVQAIAGVRGVALRALKLFSSSPPATFHVLRAVLLLLGRDPAAIGTWREVAGSQLHMGTFEELVAYDATQERDAALWKQVRAAYKAVQRPRDLERELPQCGLGALLLQWLKQVRVVARKAAALRAADKALAAAEATQTGKEQQLVGAKEAKVKADEAEAAAVAAAAAEEDEATRAAAEEEAAAAAEEEAGGEEE